MNYLHLPSSSRDTATAWNFPLGIEGFRYADLNRVRRLMALYQAFRDELRCPPERILGVLDHMDRKWGGVEGYLEAAGMTPRNIDRLTTRLA